LYQQKLTYTFEKKVFIYIHTFHGHISVIETAGCGTSHKYTNIKIYSIKYHKHFTEILSSLRTNKFTYRIKGVCT